MTYEQTVNWMFQQLPMYQHQGKTAFKKDLTNIRAFCEHLQQPQQNFKSIHVGGTNGKGSVSHMLASILQAAGYRVGLYTSPHLRDFRERIKINGAEISEQAVIDFIQSHQGFLNQQRLSFFEMTVGMAFDYFAHQHVDVAIVEVGMGGRLDSTNIIQPCLSVITNIGMDHTAFLGNTKAAIAAEKAGIIKPGVPVVIGEYTEETLPVFEQAARNAGSCLCLAEDFSMDLYPSDLLGDYQIKNKQTVFAAVELLRSNGWSIDEHSLQYGVKNAAKSTGLRGRWDVIQQKTKVICDTAHNPDGLAIVLPQLLKESFKQLHIVLGVVNDKDLSQILPLFPKTAQYYFCQLAIPRGKKVGELQEAAKKYQLVGKKYNSVAEAYSAANQNATDEDVIFVGGSTFTVAEII